MDTKALRRATEATGAAGGRPAETCSLKHTQTVVSRRPEGARPTTSSLACPWAQERGWPGLPRGSNSGTLGPEACFHTYSKRTPKTLSSYFRDNWTSTEPCKLKSVVLKVEPGGAASASPTGLLDPHIPGLPEALGQRLGRAQPRALTSPWVPPLASVQCLLLKSHTWEKGSLSLGPWHRREPGSPGAVELGCSRQQVSCFQGNLN